MIRDSNVQRVVQLVPAFHCEDAIGQQIRTLHKFFQQTGWESHIVALDADPELADQVTLWTPELAHTWRGAIWILHYALPSPLSTFFRQVEGPRVLIYHNVTPPEYFLPWAPDLAYLAWAGRQELVDLPHYVDLAIADSQFNASELQAVGFASVSVMPILIEWNRYPPPSELYHQVYFDPFYEYWLFVGRIVPNKRIEDLIRLVFWTRKYYHTATRLLIVGKRNNAPRYVQWLYELRSALHLSPQDVAFLGVVSYHELASLYTYARLFITLSDHEGFCLPVLEAMHYGTPVIAYAAGALPETVGHGGALVTTRDFTILSEWIPEYLQQVEQDPKHPERVHTHLAQFDPEPYLIFLRQQLEALV